MAFDTTQIADARAKEIYKGLKEEGMLDVSMVDLLCKKVPKSGIPGIEGKIKSLDFQAMVGNNNLTGFDALNASSEEMATPLTDRDFKIQKIQKHKEYARGLEGDALFKKIKESFVPHLSRQIEMGKDSELDTILTAAGTSSTNAQDVTERQLSAGSNETWDDANSDPLGDLRGACQDANADTIFLGVTKANELQDHAQLQSLSNMKYLGAEALARYLEGFCQVDRVVIGRKIYQNGAISASADMQFLSKDVAACFNSENLLYLDWSGPEFRTDDLVSTNVKQLHAIVHGAIVVVDPQYFIAFTDQA